MGFGFLTSNRHCRVRAINFRELLSVQLDPYRSRRSSRFGGFFFEKSLQRLSVFGPNQPTVNSHRSGHTGTPNQKSFSFKDRELRSRLAGLAHDSGYIDQKRFTSEGGTLRKSFRLLGTVKVWFHNRRRS